MGASLAGAVGMKKSFVALAALFGFAVLFHAPAHAQTVNALTGLVAQPIGKGCTTAFYIDQDCDGCGDGVYASDTFSALTIPAYNTWPTGYQVISTFPATTTFGSYYSVSDTPDADDTDPTVCTTAQWQAKWGSTNAGLVSFLEAKKGLTSAQVTNVYYVSQTGNDSTGTVNNIALPYRTMTPILAALHTNYTSATPGGIVIVRGALLSGSGTVAAVNTPVTCNTLVNGNTSCTLSSAWTGPSALNGAIATSCSGASGCDTFTATTSTGQILHQVIVTNGGTAISWYQGITGSPTTSLTINYGQLTVTSAPSPANLLAGQWLMMSGLPVDTFLLCGSTGNGCSGNTGTGGTGTYYVSNAAVPISTVSSATAFTANWGTTLNFNSTTFQMSGAFASGVMYPVYVMSYPGEWVMLNAAWLIISGYYPTPNVCCVTIDGIKFLDPLQGLSSNQGNAVQLTRTTHVTLTNDEFVGFDKVFATLQSNDFHYINNVCHDINSHCVYLGTAGAADCQLLETAAVVGGDAPLFLDQLAYAAGQPNTGCVIYRSVIAGSVFYDTDVSGYDVIHLNTWLDAPVVSGDIISYTGGSPLTMQWGNYNNMILGDLIFDYADNCITLDLYGYPPYTLPYQGLGVSATNRWVTVLNTVCYGVFGNNNIRNQSAAGDLFWDNSTGLPNWNKDVTLIGNILMTDDQGSEIGTVPLQYESTAFPETNTVNDNIFYSSDCPSGPCNRVAYVSSGGTSTVPDGTYTFASWISEMATLGLSSQFSDNTYANPNFPIADPVLYTQAPGSFNFGKSNLR